ncbi:MAG TPA: HNH endonuclease [Acidimicrobiales bacterium]|nr:HNH endonuclease [Acidimicrobiales bacterium]
MRSRSRRSRRARPRGGGAIPGCETRFARLRVHHVWWWEHGGPTDLDNLLPICSHQHSCVHDKGWHLKLTATP